jgi:P4 family phage/plasmid primase-like protien
VELRALNVADGYRTRQTRSGFYDSAHLNDMVREAIQVTNLAEGVYFTLNPLNRALLSRRRNRFDEAHSGGAASDMDVLRRRLLLVDVDPVRLSGISSTDGEKDRAWEMIERVRLHLAGNGWPDPAVADSGNGYHLLYRIDLPADDGGLVRQVLTALAQRFDLVDVKIDQKVFNPARIVKLYGTKARKGDSTEERPHRWTRVCSMPTELKVVPVGLLDQLAPQAVEPVVRSVAVARSPACIGLSPGRDRITARARAYLDKVPPAVSGQGGHDQTFTAACALVLGFDLSVEDALPLLQQWNNTCQPPWSEKELRHKLLDADKKTDERGYLLHPARVNERAQPDDPTTDKVAGSAEPVKAVDDPHRLARHFLNLRYRHGRLLTLRCWHDEWWAWSSEAYRLLPESELRYQLWPAIEEEFTQAHLKEWAGRAGQEGAGRMPRSSASTVQKVTQGLVSNVLGALGGETLIPSHVEQPSWLTGEGEAEGRDYLAMENGLLRLEELLNGGKDVLDGHSPAWFSPVCLPYRFDPMAQCPRWDAFLRHNLEADSERIDLLQEWFGYCLTGDTTQQRFLVLEGEGSNGKSVVCAALTALLGEANVTHVALEAFGGRFALTQTLGKLANIASEVGDLDKAAEGILKAFTAGDRMTFDRKGISPVEAMPTARLVLATNNRPRFTDRSGGLWRRMLLMPLQVQIQAHERVYGMDKPAWWVKENELPGIFNWAVAGLKRLRQTNRFTESRVCQEALDQYREECDPARTFLNESYQADPNGQVVTTVLYQQYKDWCDVNNYRPLASGHLGREVKRVFPGSDKRKVGTKEHRHYVYQGIATIGWSLDRHSQCGRHLVPTIRPGRPPAPVTQPVTGVLVVSQ